ncbi:MAG: EAL domain-containing protein [Pseudomonadota bacterium]
MLSIKMADSANELTLRVFVERLHLFHQSLAVSNIAVVVNTLVLSYLLYTPDNRDIVVSWCTVTLVIALARSYYVWRYHRSSDEDIESNRRSWYWRMLVGALLSGFAWGLAGYLLYDSQSMLSQTLLAFMIAGMCAGSMVSLSAFAEASAGFLFFSLVPFIVRLWIEGTQESLVMALIAMIYLFFMVVFARKVNHTVLDGLEMKFLRSRAEEKIERQALYDELTGLPNRRLLQDRLSQALARAKRHNRQAALLFLDLDFFKRVNDSLGHSIGDQLLIEVGNRMLGLLRDSDTAARLGGDEFVALLSDLDGEGENVIAMVRRRGEELRRAIERPMDIRGNEIHITVSIGVSLLNGETNHVDDLLRHADTAMYRAKDDGRNTLRFFVSDMQDALAKRMEIERQLRSALDNRRELELFLQPQFNKKMRIIGAECLLRWQRQGNFFPPTTFIPVAEDCGLIYRLGDWVIEEACALGAKIAPFVDHNDFSLALNVSPRQFRQKGFSEKVLEAIDRERLPKNLIELEVTEGLLIDDVDDTVAKMQMLREAGCRFSIDDFGTGYSSLRYLKSLPVDTLKVDQSFVRDVLSDPGDASIVRAIVSMARTLDLEVVAEGVETQEVHDFLVGADCDKFQGFHYAKPMPVDAFLALLSDQRATSDAGPQRQQQGA